MPPYDIQSYQSSPNTTQVDTRAPGMSFVSSQPQDYSTFFRDMLKAKMDWERWKIQQQMRMQRMNQAPAPQAVQQRQALQAAPKPAGMNEGMVPIFTGMQGLGPNMVPGYGRPSLMQGPGMDAAGYIPAALAGEYAGPKESTMLPSQVQKPQISPEMLQQAFMAGTQAPDTRAGYFGYPVKRDQYGNIVS